MKSVHVSTNSAPVAQPHISSICGDWQPIRTDPIGPSIILANEKTGTVCAGYGEWMDGVPVPRFVGMDDTGFGRFKATHWTPFPIFKI
jgi:hypothetical protein